MAITVEARFEPLEWPSVSPTASKDTGDEPLVKAAQGGDRAAFGQLYQRYVRMVHGILLARVPSAAAEDLVHDVFLQALPKLAALRDVSRFGPWLAAIARNRATDFHRRTKPDCSLDDQAGAAEAPQNPERGIGIEDGIALLSAVRELPDVYREPLVLYYYEQRSVEEVGRLLGITPRTAPLTADAAGRKTEPATAKAAREVVPCLPRAAVLTSAPTEIAAMERYSGAASRATLLMSPQFS